jgi:hypothetical protein
LGCLQSQGHLAQQWSRCKQKKDDPAKIHNM